MKAAIALLTASVFAGRVAPAAFASPPGYNYDGEWGKFGSGNGRFMSPCGVDVAPNGNVYVADTDNHRIQYFRRSDPAVSPASLGRVKALFK